MHIEIHFVPGESLHSASLSSMDKNIFLDFSYIVLHSLVQSQTSGHTWLQDNSIQYPEKHHPDAKPLPLPFSW